jgi:hypothetical protein
MADRVSARFGWGLGVIALVMLLLPLLLNLLRGGASGVGRDPRTQGSDLVFAVTYAATADPGPLSGTFYLIVAREEDPEPRRQLVSGGQEPFVFRRAVVAWQPGRPFELTDADPGSPLPSIAHIPAGYYWVQGIFEPEGAGNGAADSAALDWATRPGNLVSRPVELYVDPRSEDVLRVHLARRIVAAANPEAP